MKLTNLLTRLRLLFAVVIFAIGSNAIAKTQPVIIVSPNTLITHNKTYDNVTLDMSNGSFIIQGNVTLTIKNSLINGTISKDNPILIAVDQGKLVMTNDQVNVKSVGIYPHPTTQSLNYVIGVATGSVNLTGNRFALDQPYTVGLLITSASIPTTGMNIVKNTIQGFHGAFYVLGTDNATISGNILRNNSYGNIVIIGSNSKISDNTIYFAGSNRLGDSIDVIDSNNILVTRNLLLTPTCRGTYIVNSSDITFDANKIHGGITYGVKIITFPETLAKLDIDLADFVKQHKFKHLMSMNINILNNYLSQNRYGLAADDVDGLNVENNLFIQRFPDAETRKFWTNNDVLLQNVTNLNWNNNMYKEAYTQEEGGDNSQSNKLVAFPQSGGVVL